MCSSLCNFFKKKCLFTEEKKKFEKKFLKNFFTQFYLKSTQFYHILFSFTKYPMRLRYPSTSRACTPSHCAACGLFQVLLRKWWRQFAHTWRHFLFTVPLMRFLQGRRHSWFCGAYTLANTHEIATISGLAVAERLGAPYPFRDDALAAMQFDTYMKFLHGR